MQEHNQLVRQIENAKQARKGSIIKKTLARCFVGENIHTTSSRRDILRDSIRRSITIHNEFHNKQIKSNTRVLRKAAAGACRSIYGVILLSTLPVFGVTIIALTISWNTVPIELFDGMTDILRMLTYSFQACFTLVAFFVWDANNFFAFTDVAACLLLVPLSNWYLHNKYQNNGVLQPPDITLSCLLTAYLTARVWAMVIKPRHCSWRSSANCAGSYRKIISTLDRLEILWITRSSNLVAEIVPELDKIYNELVKCWGYSYAREVCRISVYLTDKDKCQVSFLQKDLEDTALFHHGCIHLTGRRPNLQELIQNYTLELVCTRRNSYSLLAFCGSPQLAMEIHQAKISNEMITSITGNKNHQMEFISESFGGISHDQKKRKVTATNVGIHSDDDGDGDAISSLGFADTTMSRGEEESLVQSAPLTKIPSDAVDKTTMMNAREDTVYSVSRQEEYVCAVAGHYFL